MPETRRITIDAAACTGDGICAALCPAFVFEQPEMGAPPVVAREEDCIRCGHCVAGCPAGAVRVRGVKTRDFPPDRAGPAVSPDDLLDLLRRRRSVRRMTGDPVDPEALRRIVEAVSTAPTAKNARAVRVTVVEDPQLRRALVERCLVVYRRLVGRMGNPLVRLAMRLSGGIEPEMIRPARRAFGMVVERLEAGEDVILFEAPATVVLSAPAGLGMGAQDCSCAMMNGVLMAEALGLGTCIMGYFIQAARRDRRMRELLGLPDYEQVYAAFTVGRARYPMRRLIERRRFRVNRPCG